MTFSLLFERASGDVAILKVIANDAGEVQSWSSWSLSGQRVNLDTADKWRAIGALGAEAQRLALESLAGGES